MFYKANLRHLCDLCVPTQLRYLAAAVSAGPLNWRSHRENARSLVYGIKGWDERLEEIGLGSNPDEAFCAERTIELLEHYADLIEEG